MALEVPGTPNDGSGKPPGPPQPPGPVPKNIETHILCYAIVFPGRESAFRAKIRPGRPIYGPEARLRNMEYCVTISCPEALLRNIEYLLQGPLSGREMAAAGITEHRLRLAPTTRGGRCMVAPRRCSDPSEILS